MTDRRKASAGDGHVDGNAAAGVLQDVFQADVTEALGICRACGDRQALAETLMYGPSPGIVLRCRGCEGVLLRLVVAGGRTWLDMGGLVTLSWSTTPDGAHGGTRSSRNGA